jgi:hypothetical protein
MAKRSEKRDVRERITQKLGDSAQGPGAGYSVSTAVSEPLKRKLRGRWMIREHLVGEEEYLARFVSRALRGMEIEGGEYTAEYEFRESICLKRVEIRATILGEEANSEYYYRLRVASIWDLEGAGFLSIRPEMGYQCTELGGEPAAVKDLDEPPEPVIVAFRFEGDSLVLEEGDDYKRLERIR